MKRTLRSLLTLIFVIGIIVALWPLGQRAYGLWSQYSLRAAWRAEAAQAQRDKTPPIKQAPRLKSKIPARAAAAPARAKASRWPPTRLIAADIDLDTVVVQGWTEADLRGAPGHYTLSALPGAPGNCVIAAHHNTYGAWFNRISELQTGATIELRTPRENFTYQVIGVDMVTDTDSAVLAPPTAPGAPPQLTLITCTVPLTSNRIVVRAEIAEQ